jgi:hypothetical protein
VAVNTSAREREGEKNKYMRKKEAINYGCCIYFLPSLLPLLRWRMYKNATRVLILLEASYFRWLRVFSLRRHSTRAPE